MLDRWMAVLSASTSEEYRWAVSVGKDVHERKHIHSFNQIDESGCSIVVTKNDDSHFSILVAGLDSGRKDYQNRIIRTAIYISNLSAVEARVIAISALANETGLSDIIEEAINDHDDIWTVDYATLDRFLFRDVLSQMPPSFQGDAPAFDSALVYQLNPERLKILKEELGQFSFTASSGIKLLVTAYPRDPEVVSDRLVWKTDHEKLIGSTPVASQIPTPTESRRVLKTVFWVLGIVSLLVVIGWLLSQRFLPIGA